MSLPKRAEFTIIDDTFTPAMITAQVPGAVWGAVLGVELVHVGSFGTTSIDGSGRRPDEHTLFRIASMTKSFTAATLMSLRDDGALALDDPVAAHVPELAGLRGPTSDSPVITLRHLLSMDAGIATDDAWADRHLDASAAELDRYFADGVTFAVAPGTAFEYSNLGYAILGRVITNVTGRPFQQVITERIINPLGLRDTVWVPEARHDDVAIGHRLVDGVPVVDVAPLGDGGLAAMGGLWSTIADLARWTCFIADAFPARDDADDGPLRRATRREMQQVWRSTPLEIEQVGDGGGWQRAGAVGYGAGLDVFDDLRLGPMAGHSGGLPGFGSNMRWCIERSLAIVALGNLTYAPMGRTLRNAFDALVRADVVNALAPRRVVAVSAPLTAAAVALVELLNEWDDTTAGAVFEDNVDLDDVYNRRAAAARVLRERVGVLTLDRIEATTAVAAKAFVRATRGEVTILFDLSPRRPPRVQFYEVTVVEPELPPADELAAGEAVAVDVDVAVDGDIDGDIDGDAATER